MSRLGRGFPVQPARTWLPAQASGAVTLTVADCALAPTMLFVAMVLPMLDAPSPLEGRPRLAAWWAVVQERPSVQAVHDEQRAAALAEIGR